MGEGRLNHFTIGILRILKFQKGQLCLDDGIVLKTFFIQNFILLIK